MISKKVVAICAAFGVVFTGTSLAVPAVADPVANSYSIVGSDTLEDAVNAIVNGAQGSQLRLIAKNESLGSFDATGSPCIVTKKQKKRMTRPNGSSDGVKALSASIKGIGYASTANTLCDENGRTLGTSDVDMARSSSTPTSNLKLVGDARPGSDEWLAYYPFGRDAMAYAYTSGSDPAFASIDRATLKEIFECTTRTVGGVTVTPVIPQSGSGTRSAWLTAIGATELSMKEVSGDFADANNTVPVTNGCVVTGQEHDGRSLTATNMIMPMSVSRWVAMKNDLSFDKSGNAVIVPVAGVTAPGGAAITSVVSGTSPNVVPNEDYYKNATWGRETWLVVEYDRVDPTSIQYDPFLAAALNKNIDDSLTNINSTEDYQSGYWKKKFGILAPLQSTQNAGVLIVRF